MLLEEILLRPHQIHQCPDRRILKIEMTRVFVLFQLFEEIGREDELFDLEMIVAIGHHVVLDFPGHGALH